MSIAETVRLPDSIGDRNSLGRNHDLEDKTQRVAARGNDNLAAASFQAPLIDGPMLGGLNERQIDQRNTDWISSTPVETGIGSGSELKGGEQFDAGVASIATVGTDESSSDFRKSAVDCQLPTQATAPNIEILNSSYEAIDGHMEPLWPRSLEAASDPQSLNIGSAQAVMTGSVDDKHLVELGAPPFADSDLKQVLPSNISMATSEDPPAYDYVTGKFNQAAIDDIIEFRDLDQFPAGYRFIAARLAEAIDPATGQPAIDTDVELHRSQLFTLVGAQANEGSGLSSLVIRSYTGFQAFFRRGEIIERTDMDRASDAVASSIFTTIDREQGAMPAIDRIADFDALNIRAVLFPNLNELNPAWAGVALYPLAGVNEFDRLVEEGDPITTALNYLYYGLSTDMTIKTVRLALANPITPVITPEDYKIAEGVLELWVKIGIPEEVRDLVDEGVFPTDLPFSIKTPEDLVDLDILDDSTKGFHTGGFEDNQLSGTALTDAQPDGTAYHEVYHGGAGNDDIFADHETDPNKYGSDLAFGGPGADLLIGGWGSDHLYGGEGADLLFGSTGWSGDFEYGPNLIDPDAQPALQEDILQGGKGNDVMVAGNNGDGRTVFVFTADGGHDTVEMGIGDVIWFKDLTPGDITRFVVQVDFEDLLIVGNPNLIGTSDSTFYLPFGVQHDFGPDPVIVFGPDFENPTAEWFGADLEDKLTDPDGQIGEQFKTAEQDFLDQRANVSMAGTSGNDTMSGAGGDDVLASLEGDDTLNGLGGNDTLLGGAGQDILNGGAGDDLLSGGAGNDQLDGGTGTDTASFAGATQAVTVDLATGTATGAETGSDTLVGIESVIGGDGNDILTGDTGSNTLDGGAGNDVINGQGGNDILVGGLGDDDLNGGSGSDRYLVGPGFGSDDIADFGIGAGEVDALEFAAGVLPADVSVLRGSSKDLLVTLGTDQVKVIGQFDIANPTFGIEEIRFADGTIWDRATILEMVLTGGEGDDLLLGFDGDDTIRGLGGNDSLQGLAGNDTLFGGAGNDGLSGFTGNDILYGGAGNDSLSGYLGTDTLDGGAGDDFLNGGADADTYLFGLGYGADIISDFDATAGVVDVVDLSGVAADTVSVSRSGAYNVVVTLAGGVDQLTLGGQLNTPASGIEEIHFAGGVIWDRATIEGMFAPVGTDGNDTLVGFGVDDTIDGGLGDDTIDGLDGNDILIGGAGIDDLDGGNGDDRLDGGTGNDELNGRAGADTYVFNSGYGADRIVDSSTAPGVVDVLEFGAGIATADIVLSRSGTNLVLSVDGSSDSVTLASQFFSDTHGVEEIRFADGTIWDQATIDAMTATGTSADDVLTGTVYNDLLSGEGGTDTLTGLAGNDSLSGGSGNDRLVGGAGDDSLTGGVGADTFSFDGLFGADTIFDYEAGIDTVEFVGFTAGDVALSNDGADTLVNLGAAGSVVLAGAIVESTDQFAFV